jgi:hypothetical protein
MKSAALVSGLIGVAVLLTTALAYPPAVGILGPSESCLTCHVNNGPWGDDSRTIVDVIDKKTGESLKQADGTFLIEAKRFAAVTVITVIGRAGGDSAHPPYRNAWLYVDPEQIGTSSLSAFAPGWSVDLPMACRLVGDKVSAYEGARVTALPMTVRPLDEAGDAVIDLQIMLTSGEAIKGDATKGLISNCLVRKVRLRVGEE